MDSWKASFLRAGVYPESVCLDANSMDDDSFGQNLDPNLERQVETIRNLVDSYVKIETKRIKDQIPKIITCMFINKLREFIKYDLLRTLMNAGDHLMEESPAEIEKRENLLRTYESLREALQIINEVNMNTTYVPPPPPLKKDWLAQPSIPASSVVNSSSSSSSSNRHTLPSNSHPLPSAKPSLPPAPSILHHSSHNVSTLTNSVAAAAISAPGILPPKPTQTVPPRPKQTPAAAFVNHNTILQPTKAPVPHRTAPAIPPRR